MLISELSPFFRYWSKNKYNFKINQNKTRLALEPLEDRVVLDHALSCGLECEPHAFWYVPAGTDASELVHAHDDHAHDDANGDGSDNFVTGSKWPQSGGTGSAITITYSYSNLLDGSINGLTNGELRAAMEEAFALWSQYSPLNFVELADTGTAVSEANYSSDGQPMIRIGHHYIDGNSGANVLAHAYYPPYGGLAGDIHFDNGNQWTVGLFLETAVHELGHSLGLGHEQTDVAIMNPSLGFRYSGLGTAFLYQDDIDGIRANYGSGAGSVTPLTDRLPAPQIFAPNPVIGDTRPTFQWGEVSGAAQYEIWVNNASGQRVLHNTSLTDRVYQSPFDLASGDYTVWVRAINGSGQAGEWSAPYSFTIDLNELGTPTLTAPAATTYDDTPTFFWTAANNATRYELWVNNSSNERVLHNTNIAATSYTAPTAMPLGDYVAWVRAFDSAGNASAWSAAHRFNIDIAIIGTPTLQAPASVTDDDTPRFVWTEADHAYRYEIWVNNSAGQRVVHNTAVAFTSYTVTTPLAPGSYTAWVRAYDSTGRTGSWSSPYQFSINTLLNVTPVLQSASGAITGQSSTFDWAAITGAVRYEIWVNNASGQRVLHNTAVTGTSYTATSQLEAGNYTAWVRAFDSVDQSSKWSAPLNFEVKTLDQRQPTLLAPGGTVNSDAPTFSWQALPDAVRYELWVNDASEQRVLHDENITGTSFTPSTGLDAGNYRFWVRAFDNAGVASQWSAPMSFSINADLPGQTVLLSPGGSITDETPTFTWEAAANAVRYEIWVNNASDQRVLHDTNVSGTSWTATASLAPGSYRFWVRAFNSAGEAGDWSAPMSFTVLSTLPDDNYESNNDITSAYDLSNQERRWLSNINGYGVQNDDDWYRINITPGYERLLVYLAFYHAEGDIDLAVYNASGQYVTGSWSATDNEILDYVLPSAGTYYLRVYYGDAGNLYDLWWDDYRSF